MAESLRYAVILKQRSALKPAEMARAVAAARGQPAVDLASAMRRCWGLVELDVDEGLASREAQALCAAGLPAVAIPASLVGELPAAQPVRRLEGSAGSASLLAAAAFTRRQARVVKFQEGSSPGKRALQLGLSLATGLPINLLGGAQKQVERTIESSELVFYLDICSSDPPRRLRVDAQDFDFSCLGQLKGYDASGNFRTLLKFQAASARALNAGAEGLLADRPVRELGYASLDDLDREECWLLTLAALKP